MPPVKFDASRIRRYVHRLSTPFGAGPVGSKDTLRVLSVTGSDISHESRWPGHFGDSFGSYVFQNSS